MKKTFELALAGGAAALGLGASAAPHSFDLTYRAFGPVTASSDFQPGQGYALRFEGCYAKHSAEAICGFTLRADQALSVTNLANLSHGSGADGSAIRTCCMFVQGDPRGFPITPSATPPADVAVLSRALKPGETIGLMLRVPNYRAAAPLAAITFSRGQGDPGVRAEAHIAELP